MSEKPGKNVCGEDVLQAVRAAYPDNLVDEAVIYDEDSYFGEIREKLYAALKTIEGAHLMYDRPPEGRPHWDEGVDPTEDPPSWVEEPGSYAVFFLALRDEQFEFTSELEEETLDEDGEPVSVSVPAVGRIGCAVGVSVVGPFAVIVFTEMEWNDTGSQTLPDIWPRLFTLDFQVLDVESHYTEVFGEEGGAALRNLRDEISRILESFGIRVLSKEEFRAPIPKLKTPFADDAPSNKQAATVADALFFPMR